MGLTNKVEDFFKMEKLSKMKDYELLGKKVYRILKSKIVNGSFKPGSKLSETKIANQMEISRTPVREAMRELSARGFVNMIPNQGIIVKSDSIEDIQKVMQIRGVLEGLAARLATPLITEGKIKILETCNEKMEKFISKNNVLAFGKESEKFHKVILEVCGNDLLVQIRKNLADKIYRFLDISLNVPGKVEISLKEHIKITEALKQGDADKADEFSRLHIESVLKNILIYINKT